MKPKKALEPTATTLPETTDLNTQPQAAPPGEPATTEQAAETPPPAKAPTPAELKAKADDVKSAMSRFFGGAPAEADLPHAPAAANELPEEAPAEKTEEEPEPEPKKPAPQALELKPKPLAEADDVEAIVREATGQTQPQPQQENQPDAPTPLTLPPGLRLGKEEQLSLAVIQQMEELDPARKGLAQQSIEFWSAEQQWIRDWTAKHPDDEFSDDNPEYQAWAAAHDPTAGIEDYDTEFKLAERALIKKELRQEFAQEKAVEKRQQTEAQQFQQRVPAIQQEAAAGVTHLIANAVPDEYRALLQQNGQTVVNEQFDQALAEAEPDVREILMDEAQKLQLSLQVLRLESEFPNSPVLGKMANGVKLPGGDVFVPQAQLVQDIDAMENEMMVKPREETTVEGRKFTPMLTYDEAIKRIQGDKNLDANRKHAAIERYKNTHWRLDTDTIAHGLTLLHTQNTRARVQKQRGYMEKRGATTKAAANNPAPGSNSGTPTESPTRLAKPRSPATVSASDAPNPNVIVKDPDKEITQSAVKRILG